jgi:two-component system LytT family response regulator
MPLTCLIIDDEQPSRENLKAILSDNFPDIQILGDASNLEEAVTLIQLLQPQLLFLDIEMGGSNGLQLLANFEHPSFEVIFVTAYDSYAVKAFKTIASDYLLKPVDLDELQMAILKIYEKFEIKKLKSVADLPPIPPASTEKLKVTTSDGAELIPCDQIMYLQSINYYTNIVLETGREIISSRHLKDYESLLSTGPFFRMHNSFIVNVGKIRLVMHNEGGSILLTNGKQLKISRRRKEGFLQFIDNFPGLAR